MHFASMSFIFSTGPVKKYTVYVNVLTLEYQMRFLAALAALSLTLVSQSVSQWLTAALEFQHK